MSLEHEAALLGAVLGDPRIIERFELSASIFGGLDNRAIFAAVERARAKGIEPDDIAITDELRAAGREDLIVPAAAIPRTSGANAKYYRDALREERSRREIGRALRSGLERIDDTSRGTRELLDEIERDLLGAVKGGPESDDASAAALLPGYLKELDARGRAAREGRAESIDLGLPALDSILGPVRPGEIVVVAARPGAGKTAFALGTAAHVALDLRRPVAVFSLEMTREELLDRIFAARYGYPLSRLRSGSLQSEDFDTLTACAEELYAAPLALYDGAHGLGLLRSRIRREKATRGLRLAVVDYLGLLDLGAGGNVARWERIGEATRALKLAALDLRLVVLLCVQLNREADGREPTLGQLRDSGSIEQDADRVILLHRPSPEDPRVEAIIAKNRHGRLGRASLAFEGGYVRFR